MENKRHIQSIKNKLTSEGVGLQDHDEAIKCLAKCVAGKKLIELYKAKIMVKP